MIQQDGSVKLLPPISNCESMACGRLILLGIVGIHRLRQLFSAGSLTELYFSMQNYKNAASHRTTFHKSCLSLIDDLIIPMHNEDGTEVVATKKDRPMRSTARGMSVAPALFAASQTFKTPQKNATKKIIDSGNMIDDDVRGRWENCIGMPVMLFDEKVSKKGTKQEKKGNLVEKIAASVHLGRKGEHVSIVQVVVRIFVCH